jgi:KDO2-lipid IV(A) lauroyltransferase
MNPFLQIKEALMLGLAKTIFGALSLLSLGAGHTLACVLGQCWWWYQGRSAQITQQNIALCFPQLTPTEQHALAKSSLLATAQLGVEIAQAWLWPRTRSAAYILRVQNEHLFDEAIQSQKGVIVLAPHLGNWEWFNIYLASKTQMTALYEPAKSSALDTWIHQLREKSSGSKMVPTTREGIVALYKTLQSGGAVGILPDQEPEVSGGQFAHFFGVETLSMTLVSRLAQKTGAHVLCGFAKRLPDNVGFEIMFNKTSDDIYSSDMRTSVSALNASVEQSVREAPEQYQWEYNRFKKTPESVREKEARLKARKENQLAEK